MKLYNSVGGSRPSQCWASKKIMKVDTTSNGNFQSQHQTVLQVLISQ